MAGPPGTLGDLERRVQLLEQSIRADQLNPAAYSLNAAGEAEASFTGKVNARGLVIPNGHVIGSGSLGPGSVERNEIQWVEEGGGVVASIGAAHYAAKPPSLFSGQETQINALAEELLARLNLNVELTPAELPKVEAYAGPAKGLGGHNLTVVDGEGRSSFLQIAGALAKRRLQLGTFNLEWPGGSHFTTELEVATLSLGEPAFVFLQALKPTSGDAFAVLHTVTAGGFIAYAENAREEPGKGTLVTVQFLAIA